MPRLTKNIKRPLLGKTILREHPIIQGNSILPKRNNTAQDLNLSFRPSIKITCNLRGIAEALSASSQVLFVQKIISMLSSQVLHTELDVSVFSYNVIFLHRLKICLRDGYKRSIFQIYGKEPGFILSCKYPILGV